MSSSTENSKSGGKRRRRQVEDEEDDPMDDSMSVGDNLNQPSKDYGTTDATRPGSHQENQDQPGPGEGQEDDEWEEETSYIVLDLGPRTTHDMVKTATKLHNGYSLKGLDTPEPSLRVGNLYFKGSYDTIIGTDLIFAASARPQKKTDAPAVPRYGISNAIYNKENTSGSTDALTLLGKSSVRIKFD